MNHAFDSRFTQANERTLLAWLRTGVGLAAFGFGVAKSAVLFRLIAPMTLAAERLSEATGAALVTVGILGMVVGLVRYHRVRAALHAGQQVPDSAVSVTAFSILVVFAALAIMVYQLVPK